MTDTLDVTDRAIINALQGGFPISERPFAEAAAALGLTEQDLIDRIAALMARGVLTRGSARCSSRRPWAARPCSAP